MLSLSVRQSVRFGRPLPWFCCFVLLLLGIPQDSATAQLSSRQFEDRTRAMGLDIGPQLTWGCAWGDANGDGFPDLFVSNHYQIPYRNQPNFFFSTPEGRYRVDTVPFYTRTPDMHGAGWFDFDRDGDQDLVISTGRANRNALLVNYGGSHFEEKAVELGADFPLCRGRGPLLYDHNHDGLCDILMTAGPTLAPDQLPTSLALQTLEGGIHRFHRLEGDSAGILPDLASTQAVLVDPDQNDQLNPMIVTVRDQPWAAGGCLPFEQKGKTDVQLTIEVLAADFNGDMIQDLYYIQNRLDQSHVEYPFPMNWEYTFGVNPIHPDYTSITIPPLFGEAAILDSGLFRYKPNEDFTGIDSALVRFCDSSGMCSNRSLRFLVLATPAPVPEGFIPVPQNGFTKFYFDRWLLPFRYRLRGNLLSEGDPVAFAVRSLSDSILIAFSDQSLPTERIHIGRTGYHPGDPFRILLRADDEMNYGKPLVSDLEPPFAFIGYDTTSRTWTYGIHSQPLAAFSSIPSVFSPRPMKLVSFLNFDSLPVRYPDRLLLGVDGGGYVDASTAAGLDAPNESYSGVYGDFDNDMDLDIYLSMGIIGRNEFNVLLENNGTGKFSPVYRSGGASGTRRGSAGAASTADANRDGYLDLFVCNGRDTEKTGPYQFFQNSGNANHWLGIELQGRASNRDGYGAVVRVWTAGKGQIRFADGGFHRFVQNDAALHFGLGPHKHIDSITVRWPSGIRSVWTGVLADQYVTLEEPTEPAYNCFAPVRLNSKVLAELGVRLRWSAVDCADGYQLRIRKMGEVTVHSLDLTDTTALIPFYFLDGGSRYQWDVRSQCADGSYSFISTTAFFDLPVFCNAPENLTAALLPGDSVSFSWDAVPEAMAYFFQRERAIDGTKDSSMLSNNHFVLPYLALGSSPFFWRVRTVCSFTESSPYANGGLFSPPLRMAADPTALSLAPNPARHTVQVIGQRQPAAFRLLDITGRPLKSGTVQPGQALDIRDLAPGTYWLFLREAGVLTERVLPLSVY